MVPTIHQNWDLILKGFDKRRWEEEEEGAWTNRQQKTDRQTKEIALGVRVAVW
jgi:hypothetical protein